MKQKPIRLRIKSKSCETNVSYIQLHNGRYGMTVRWFNRGYKKQHISGLTEEATEMVFALEDCESAEQAKDVLGRYCKGRTIEVM